MDNQKGMVLITVLIVMVLLTALGTAGVMLACIDIKISGNYRSFKVSFFQAEAATELGHILANKIHVHQNANNSDYINNPDIWSVIFTSNGNVKDHNGNSLGINLNNSPSLNFRGVVRMIVDSAGYVLYYGDHDNDPSTLSQSFWATSTDRSRGRPYYKITGHGWVGINISYQKVTIGICPFPSFELPNTALYVNGILVTNGNPQSAIGEGHPFDPVLCNVHDIIGTNPSVDNYSGNDGICGTDPCKTGSPDIVDNANPYPVDEVVDLLIESGTQEISVGTLNNPQLGVSDADDDEIYYRVGDLSINNLSGYGILAIEGSLTLGGNISWNGLIIVTGDLILNGGGSMGDYIHGSVIVGMDVYGNGNPDIFYDCQRINKLFLKHRIYKRVYWVHNINYEYDPNILVP